MAQAPREAQGIDPVLVVIPTYNERENLGPILRRLHEALPKVHALVVDDGSPDGTGKLADELAATDERMNVIHRTEKAGLGAAYVAGFRWGLAKDYATIVEMDADGSHAPEDLPRLLAEAPGDLVPRRQPLLQDRARGEGQRHHRRVPGLPA
jgi:dolichol-phosphate mannosyltransferase